MREAGFEPALPEERRLKRRVFTTRPFALHFLFLFIFVGKAFPLHQDTRKPL
jgi:hypothetical protein